MPQSQSHLTEIVVAGLLIVSLWATGLATAGVAGNNESEQGLEATTIMPNDQTPVEVEVDCNRSQVNLTAPGDYQYDATVAVANLTATGNEITRSTIGSVEGNQTIEFTDAGIVFVFVEGQSDDEQVVATRVTNCSADTSELSTTTVPDEREPAIQLDCAENAVRFTASEETEYVAKVVAVAVSPTRAATSSSTRTFEGNETVSVDEEALVAVFASTGDLGDDRTVSAIRNCSPYGPERLSGNESDDEDQADGLET